METAAKQAFMIDMQTGAVLLSKEADVQMHPSSMSKLMTVYILFSRLKEGRLKLDDTFTVSEKAWRMQGSKTFVPLGGKITVEQLLHGIITQSGNDACIVAAEGVSGSEEAFAQEMNRTAEKLGLKHSHFVNATGWPDPQHQMTSRDLAILAQRLIADFPEYYEFFQLREFTYNNIRQANRNRLLGNDIGVDGLKTGHTEDGGYGITLSAKHDNRRLILVLNGMNSEKQREEEGDRLLRYGFREFENKTLLQKGEKVAEAGVWFGEQATVPLIAGDDVTLTLPVSGAPGLKMVVKYTGPLPAPVTQGAHVADLVIKMPKGSERVVPLLAGEGVPKLDGLKRMLATLKYYIRNRNR